MPEEQKLEAGKTIIGILVILFLVYIVVFVWCKDTSDYKDRKSQTTKLLNEVEPNTGEGP